MVLKKDRGYWVELLNGNTIFMWEATGWNIEDGKILQFYKGCAEEHIVSSFTLINVVQWYYGEKR